MENCVDRIEVVELLSYLGHEIRGVLQILTLAGSGVMEELIKREIEPAYRRLEKILKKVEDAAKDKTPKIEDLDINPILKKYFKRFNAELPVVSGDRRLLDFSFKTLSQFMGENSDVDISISKDVVQITITPEKGFNYTRGDIFSSMFPDPLFTLRTALRIIERHLWGWKIDNGKLIITIRP